MRMIIKAFSILLVLFLLSQIFLISKSPSHSIVIYGNRDCGYCVKYMSELESSLRDMNATGIQIRDLGSDPKARQDLHELSNNLGIPSWMQAEVVVIIDGRSVFEGYVPAHIVVDFLIKHRNDYQVFVLYKDETHDRYFLMDEPRVIKECRISQSVQECLPRIAPNPPSIPIHYLLLLLGVLAGIALMLTVGVTKIFSQSTIDSYA